LLGYEGSVLAGEQASDHCFLKVNPMFIKPTKVALACAGILATISTAPAQSNSEFNPVVVSASRTEQSLSDVLPSVSVITRADLDRSQAKTLADALQGEPGFEFGRNGGPGGVTSIFLRGSDSKNIVILVDGVKTQTDNLGSLQFSNVPMSSVERIEVLRGNAGALYGESAIGGVINIITKSGKGDPKASALLSYGSRNTSEVAVGYSGEVNQTSFSLNLSRLDTDGFSAKKANGLNNPDRDGTSNESFVGRLSQKVSRDTEFGLTTQVVRNKTSFDGDSFITGSLTNVDVFENNSDTLGLFASSRLSTNLKSRFDVLWSSLTYKDMKNEGLRPSDDYADGLQKGKQTTYRFSNNYDVNDSHQINFGLESSDAQYELSSYTNATNIRKSKAAYVGTLKKFDQFDIQANLRRDVLDGYRLNSTVNEYQKNTYLLGLGYRLTNNYRLTATTSTGFRAPAPYEFVANQDLRPELNQSNELGVSYVAPTTNIRLVYFDTKAKDAIYYNPYAGWGEYQNMNVKNNGAELSIRQLFGATSLKVSYTNQDPVNADINLQQARRAKEFGSIDLNHQLGKYQIGGLLYWSGTRKDSDFSSTTMSSYTVLNLYASYRIDKEWVARLRVENAGDTNYELASGFNTPGRGVFATLQYQPK
jgi:vitamin B12 transporter